MDDATMADVRDWRNLSWPEFEGLDPARTLALQPVGAIEQHGPHLPVGVDAMIAEAVARAAAARCEGDFIVLILPTTQVGKSTEHIAYPGTLTLGAETLTRLWTEIGDSVARAGLRKLVFLNAHGGQPQVMEIVARDMRVRHGMLALASGWWSAGLPEGVFPEGEMRHGIHAGAVETAMMLHIAPELVRMGRAENFAPATARTAGAYARLRMVGPMQIGWMAQDLHPSGAAGDATLATAEAGRLMFEDVARRYAELLQEVAAYPLDAIKSR
jgi:creatinine amidohydrolase